MSSSSKALSILSLFSQQHPIWQPDAICTLLGFSRATGYRYIKELVDFGLLKKVASSQYALGARIIELDYQLRQSDPVLLAADPVMYELSQQTGKEVVLTALINRKQIIDIHRVHAGTPSRAFVARSRGRQRPMFQGGASKLLIAWLPRHQQRQIYQLYAAQIQQILMASSWEAFRGQLDGFKKTGFYLSWGEIEPAVGAAVVPIFNPAGEAVAVLNLLDSANNLRHAHPAQLRAVLEEAAWRIRHRQISPPLD